MSGDPSTPQFVSRGGLKLHHALQTFAVQPAGWTCADLGCSTGGFTDCLLQAGAAKVISVDTAYGQLAWKLRQDERVLVCERRNGLHFAPPELVDLVVADMGWTPQRLLIPAALKWLKPEGAFISLVKPHYELKDGKKELPRGGVLSEADAEAITQGVLNLMPSWGAEILGVTQSPILGGEHKGKGTGNAEWLAWGRAKRSGH